MPLQLYKISSTELKTSASTVTFSNIPQGYKDLKIAMSARCDSTGGYPETVNLKFNNSSTSDYTWRGLYSVTATPGSNNSISGSSMRVGSIPAVATTANIFSDIEIYIPNYRSSNNKSISVEATSEMNGSTDFTYALIMNAGIRTNSAAITEINLSLSAGNFIANSTLILYGIL
jgi:hypothetical protein